MNSLPIANKSMLQLSKRPPKLSLQQCQINRDCPNYMVWYGADRSSLRVDKCKAASVRAEPHIAESTMAPAPTPSDWSITFPASAKSGFSLSNSVELPQHPNCAPSSLALPKCILAKLSVGQQYPSSPLQPVCLEHCALSIFVIMPSAAAFLALASL